MPQMSRRRMLLCAGAGGALSLVPCSRVLAQGSARDTLRKLTWDQSRAQANWERKGGPLWVVHDDVAMFWGGARALLERKPPLASPLTGAERTAIMTSLAAASEYYRMRGLWGPMLPLGANGAFHIFYVDFPGELMGGTGPGAGDPLSDFGIDGLIRRGREALVVAGSETRELNAIEGVAREVPEGTHIMMSAPILRSYQEPPNTDHPWAPRVTLAHEMIHAIDQYAPGMARWTGVEAWLSEGSTHAIAQFALRRLGHDPMKGYALASRRFVKDIGLRPYDVTLTMSEFPRRIPQWLAEERYAKGEKVADIVNSFWETNAPYITNSFWRFLFKEEAPVRKVSAPLAPQAQVVPFAAGMAASGPAPTVPGDFELFAPFRAFAMTDADRSKGKSNSRWIDPGVMVLDRFLRTHPHPVWGATGLYRAFPAFIAHFIEWPDQVAKSRNGFLAHEKWLDAMFIDGAARHEIGVGQDIVAEPDFIPPLAARAIRFRLPPLEGAAPGIMDSGYPRVTITVTTINGPRDAIDHIHIGLRGNVLANHLAQTVRSGQGRVRRWINVDARPLFRSRTDGESVLTIINAAPDPANGRPLKVRVHIAVQVAGAFGQCSYHPMPVPGENGRMVTIPSSVSPPMGRTVPTMAAERGLNDIEVTIVQDADLVEMMDTAASASGVTGLSVERATDDPAPRKALADLERLQQMAARVSTATAKSRLVVTLILPRIEPGQIGAVPGARARVEWIEPAYRNFAAIGVPMAVTMETSAVQVTVTSNSEGSLIGTYAASFDNAPDNAERVYRGNVSGKFSIGIARDEASGEGELPGDKSAVMPTDFFIAAARAGFDTATIGRMLEQAAGGAESDGTGSPFSDGTPQTQDDSGAGPLRTAPECKFRDNAEVETYLDRFLRKSMAGTTEMTPERLAQMRRVLLADQDNLRQMLCEAGFHPGALD